MNALTEISEWVEQILRLDLDTPVRGFDGEEIGAANEQALALAKRTLYLKKQLESLNKDLNELSKREYVATVNKKSGNITLTPTDVGAASKEHKHTTDDIETSEAAQFVSSEEKKQWGDKQDVLVSGINLKTLLGNTLLGKGNIILKAQDIETSKEYSFVSEDEKEYWSNKQEILKNQENIHSLHGKSLLGSGDITLDYNDVGADPKGSATDVINNHLVSDDPHSQYLTAERAKNILVEKSQGNKPLGYIQLDEKGYIPAELAKLYEARYEITNDETERLALSKSKNLTLAVQLDENRIYYLSAELDPSVKENWKEGRTTDLSDVISVFGRSGIIKAEAGDYNADQITETDARTFVTPEQKQAWSEKQSKLTSGENLKTLHGKPLLGKGDIALTPSDIKAAKEEHKHNPEDIDTDAEHQFVSDAEKRRWDNQQGALVSGKTIKTINDENILGSGNLDITPEAIGAASKEHKHTTDDIETSEAAQFVSSEEKKQWGDKQDVLVSGESIKTINGETILGDGNLNITAEGVGAAPKSHKHNATDIETDKDNQFVSLAEKESYAGKQAKLVPGKNISTVFGKSLLTGNPIDLKDIENLSNVINDLLVAGSGMEISLNDDNKIVFKSTGNGNGGGSDLIIREETVTTKNSIYSYKVDSIYPINFEAYALKRTVATPAKTENISYESGIYPLVKTSFPDSDDTGYFPNKKEAVYTLKNTSKGMEKYNSGDIKLPTAKGNSIVGMDIKIEGDITNIVPTFTEDDTTVNGISLFSSREYTGFLPYKAFQKPLTSEEIENVPNREYWSDYQIWKNRKDDVYLGIKSDSPTVINGYGFQNFKSLFWTKLSTPPTAWEFQGRNKDSDNWVILDTQSNQSIMNSNGGWSNFMLDKPVGYKQYRIVVKNVLLESARASIPRLQLYTEPYGLLKSKTGEYYGVSSDGTLNNISDPDLTSFASDGFKKLNGDIINISLINDLFPLQVCSLVPASATVQFYTDSPQIIIHSSLSSSSDWESLNKIIVKEVYDESDKTDIFTAVTVDGLNYHVLQNGKWNSLGVLTATSIDANKLIKDGMLFLELSSIPKEKWEELIKITGEGTQLGIAYASAVRKNTDSVSPKILNVDFDDIIELVRDDSVVVSIARRSIKFKVEDEGEYKLCYRIS